MPIKRLATLMVTMFLLSTLSVAQLDKATILGTVSDSTGAVIPGAKVTLTNVGTGATMALTTDRTGFFIAPVLPVGTYNISVAAPGFKSYTQTGVGLNVSDRVDIPVRLQPGEVSEKVTVAANADLLETATATTGATIEAHLAEDLPLNGRSVTDLMVLVPGMVTLGPPSINGGADGRLFQPGLKYLVDGGDSSQIDSDFASAGYLSNARVTRVGVDAMQEFKMVTGTYSPEYGQSSGAVVNFITKSGTNGFHGNLYEFFRNEVFDSRNYFNRAPAGQPAFRLNQFGGSLGGPIAHDKLFFFGNYEGVRQRLGQAQSVYVFTDAFKNSLAPELQPVVAQLPSPNGPASPADSRLALFSRGVADELTEDSWTGRVDYIPGVKDHFTFRYSGGTTFTKTYFGVADGQFRPIPFNKHLVKISYLHTFSPTLFNEASLDVNRLHSVPAGAGTDAARNFPQTTFALGGGLGFGGAALATVGPSTFDLTVGNTAYQYSDSLSWAKGRHQFKFGAQIVQNQDNKGVNFQQFVQFLSIDDFANNDPFLILTIGWPVVGMRSIYSGFYVNDDFRVNDRLTLNMGLRYQYDTAPTEGQGRIANFNPVTGTLDPVGSSVLNAPKTNFAPRFGFAYTPFRAASTVIRGGFGLFYANLNPALAQYLPANLPDINEQHLVIFPGVGFPTPDISSAPGSTALNAMKRDWNGTYTEQWNLQVQQGLGKNAMVEIGYVGNRALHLLTANQGQEINPIDPTTGQRPYPAFSTIYMNNPCCIANYNALQTSTRIRMSRLTLGAHYTWSHALDENTQTFAPFAQNPFDLHAEYATADYDVRHNFVAYWDYQFPKIGGLPRWLGEGWQINGITSMRAGFPVNVVCGCDSAGIGEATGRPDLVPGVPLRPSGQSVPANQININAFAVPAAGSFGDARRNLVRGPAAYNTDFSVIKRFRLTEHQNIEFRTEVFNIFNTPQFANPNANLASPATFGQSFGTITTNSGFGSNRQMQFALKYEF